MPKHYLSFVRFLLVCFSFIAAAPVTIAAPGPSTVTITPPPTVTINKAVGQLDPTTTPPVRFTVVFNEEATGFDAADISFAGSTVQGTLVATVTGAGSTYTVTVNGMTSGGNVVASVIAGAATNADGIASLASTSTDNTVLVLVFQNEVVINKTALSPYVAAGGIITYQIQVYRNFVAAAPTIPIQNVLVTDVLPAGTTFMNLIPFTPTNTTPIVTIPPLNNGTLNILFPLFDIGDVFTCRMQVRVDEELTGSISNTATVGGPLGDIDPTNNSSTAVIQITVPPIITCPGNIKVNVDPDRCDARVFFDGSNAVSASGVPAPTFTYRIESENGSTTSNIPENSFPESLTFDPGLNTVTVTATNSAGASSCSFTVTVTDNIPPTLTCPGNMVVATDPGQTIATVSFNVLIGSHCADDRITVTSNVGISGTGPAGTVPFNERVFSIGVNTVTITATDPHGNSSNCSFTVTVSPPVPPTITCPGNIVLNITPGRCDAPVSFTGDTAILVTGLPTPKISYRVEFANNAIATGIGLNSFPSLLTFPAGVNTVSITAANDAGSASCSFAVTVVDNIPPAITCPENKTVDAEPGQCLAEVSLNFIITETCMVPSTTPMTIHANSELLASVSGTLNNFSLTLKGRFLVGDSTLNIVATDAAGNTSTCSFTITVVDNEKPVITNCPNAVTVECVSQIPAVDISAVTATDNCGTPTITHVGDVIGNQTCANKYTLTRTYKATDGSGNTATCSQTITVDDQTPPTITGLTPSKRILAPPNHKMVDITLAYTVNDNCVGDPTVTVTIESNEPINGTGDGDTDPDWEIIDAHHIRLRAERAAQGNGRIYTITVTVSDGCNDPVSATTEVVVAHNITGPHSGNAFKVGSTVAFTGEFWDAPGNKHTAKWLIDGSTTAKATVSEPLGNKNGKVTGSYKFTTPGVYKLQMNVTDQNGVTTYANTNGDLEAIVVIYDPNGGHTYGGGYFNSPAGALVANPSATGKASYGFAMNYFKNSTNPKGETQFEFKVGEFEFNALNFEYLVISNSMAQFKGTGKIIGGQSGVAFTMTVVDGQLDGTGVDKIRMRIYNKNNGRIIYDNQTGASDAVLPTQAVGTNSVIVISGNNNSNITQSGTQQRAEPEAGAPEISNDLDVIAYPNPSTNTFSITVQSNSKEKTIMQVVDMYGRIIETRNINANSIIRFGDRYKAGTYFVRVLQGKRHKEIKLIKLLD